MQRCQIQKDFMVSKKALKFIKVRRGWGWGRGWGVAVWGPGGGADTCKAWVAQLVIDVFL